LRRSEAYIGHNLKNYVNLLTRSINAISAPDRHLHALHGSYPANPIFPIAATIQWWGRKQVSNDLLSQANGRTPPRRKKKRVSDEGEEDEDEEEEEYGEASMDVDSRLIFQGGGIEESNDVREVVCTLVILNQNVEEF
jgi:hypothetical protein